MFGGLNRIGMAGVFRAPRRPVIRAVRCYGKKCPREQRFKTPGARRAQATNWRGFRNGVTEGRSRSKEATLLRNDHNALVLEQIRLSVSAKVPDSPLIGMLAQLIDDYGFHGWDIIGDNLYFWYGRKSDADWFVTYDFRGNVVERFMCRFDEGAESRHFERFKAGEPLGKGFIDELDDVDDQLVGMSHDEEEGEEDEGGC